jgi:hypothetical protein
MSLAIEFTTFLMHAVLVVVSNWHARDYTRNGFDHHFSLVVQSDRQDTISIDYDISIYRKIRGVAGAIRYFGHDPNIVLVSDRSAGPAHPDSS